MREGEKKLLVFFPTSLGAAAQDKPMVTDEYYDLKYAKKLLLIPSHLSASPFRSRQH
jgi:hypothetical protein